MGTITVAEPTAGAQNCSIHDLENDLVFLAEKEPLPELITETVADLLEAHVDVVHDMKPVWEGYRRPLAALGIHLCTLRDTGTWAMRGEVTIAPRPFAFRCAHVKPPGLFLMSRFACAQDDKQRDLVIKLVDKGTMEHDIYKYLAECKSLYDSDAFIGVLPPTAIIGSPYRFAFVAMPMWDVCFSPKELETIREVMTFIRCTLSGLAFLHRHRIAHRDIDQSNIVINWYCNKSPTDLCTRRLREHVQSPAVEYALFDFDLSLQIPLDTSLKRCRRPSYEAFEGKGAYHPADVLQGERYYNPFAFDVACMGNLYLCYFKEAMSLVPLLAPLISKMTTHVIDDRWSAEEAFVFFGDILAGLSPDTLDSRVSLLWDRGPVDNPDLYWSRLSPEFQSSWNTHRSPPISLFTRALRWANTTDIGYSIVSFIRRYLQIE